MKTGLYTIAIALLMVQPLKAEEWELKPCSGNNEKNWASGDNWTWDKGNPHKDKKAQWSLEIQKDDNPSLTSNYTKMSEGTAYNYYKCWRDSFDDKNPTYYYRDKTLGTTISKGAKSGPASAILFKAPRTGQYKISIKGEAVLQNKTAGYAIVTIYKLKNRRKKSQELKIYKLNSPDGFGSLQDHFKFKQTISMIQGEEFVVRIQSRNPGPATSGASQVKFKEFIIKQ